MFYGWIWIATLATKHESTDVHMSRPLVTCIHTIGFTTGANSCCVGRLPCCLSMSCRRCSWLRQNVDHDIAEKRTYSERHSESRSQCVGGAE